MATSSDTERREARRRKILENAELRMNKIIYSEGGRPNIFLLGRKYLGFFDLNNLREI